MGIFKSILAEPVRVARERHHAAAVGSKTAGELENQCYVSELRHLKALVVTISGDFCVANQIPVIGVADNAGERRESAACDLTSEWYW